ncbi:MAG: asparaginase [Clostridiales bacterium]|nr:asparaginase [Clostridiales bacterium]
MKKILLLGTGGTIACELSQSGSLAPALATADLLRYVPGIRELCEVESRQVLHLDSTDIAPAHWLILACAIRESYADYDGFVVTHGTDTMAYSAAALSYLIQNSSKPIVLTGAQKPIGAETTDSKSNLYDSFLFACDAQSHGICVVFNGEVILGTRARKVNSKSFRAFASINFPAIAQIRDGRIFRYFPEEQQGDPIFYDALNPKVALLKMYPGLLPEVLETILQTHDALLLECFGTGGLPSIQGQPLLFEAIERAANAGKTIAMTTQVQNEGSDLSVYSVGSSLIGHPRILEAHDMSSEAALVKLMWALAQSSEAKKIATLFQTQVAHDLMVEP